MDKYFKLQIMLENQPIDYLANNLEKKLDESRNALSDYIDCNKDDIVFFPNPSTAINMVAKSLDLNKDDEMLYGRRLEKKGQQEVILLRSVL